MVPNELSKLMDRHDIVVVVILSIETGKKEVVGDRAALESDFVVRTLFDDLSPKQVAEYLEGQILPRMAQQGKGCGVICKPTENTIVGLYYHDERDVIQRYDTSKMIDGEIRELWASNVDE